jgi:hypothetical protein
MNCKWINYLSFVLLLTNLKPGILQAQREIPENNLSYPVLIEISSRFPASGFFLYEADRSFLVTAKHVFLDSLKRPWTDSAIITAYPPDPTTGGRTVFVLDLVSAMTMNALLIHPSQDVVVIEIGQRSGDSTNKYIKVSPYVTLKERAIKGIIGVPIKSTKRYSEILIGNEIFLLGYPTALGITQQLPQFDHKRPLLRKGIVAGKNDSLRTIVLDCPVYYGNSGSPVIQVERDFQKTVFSVIGIITEFVPFDERYANPHFSLTKPLISNSGYSIAAPIEAVIELISQKK